MDQLTEYTVTAPRSDDQYVRQLELDWEIAQANVAYMANLLRWFCDEVDAGAIASVRTYRNFKRALTLIESGKPLTNPTEKRELQLSAAFGAGIFIGGILVLWFTGWLT